MKIESLKLFISIDKRMKIRKSFKMDFKIQKNHIILFYFVVLKCFYLFLISREQKKFIKELRKRNVVADWNQHTINYYQNKHSIIFSLEFSDRRPLFKSLSL